MTPGTPRSSIAEPSRLRDSERYTSDGVGYQPLAIEHTFFVEQKLSVTVQLQPVKVEFFERLQASSLNQVSSFIIFFTRASWASTVVLSTIALFLITSRSECVTTFAQALDDLIKLPGVRCIGHLGLLDEA